MFCFVRKFAIAFWFHGADDNFEGGDKLGYWFLLIVAILYRFGIIDLHTISQPPRVDCWRWSQPARINVLRNSILRGATGARQWSLQEEWKRSVGATKACKRRRICSRWIIILNSCFSWMRRWNNECTVQWFRLHTSFVVLLFVNLFQNFSLCLYFWMKAAGHVRAFLSFQEENSLILLSENHKTKRKNSYCFYLICLLVIFSPHCSPFFWLRIRDWWRRRNL